MPVICLYFQLHQPERLRHYDFIQIGNQHDYFDDESNAFFLRQVVQNSYSPALDLFIKLKKKHKEKFKLAFSATGTVLNQLERWEPAVLKKFKQLTDLGGVEWLNETETHGLSSIYHRTEFESQIKAHEARIIRLFGYKPTVFRNTELLFSNDLVNDLARWGYTRILVPSTEKLLGQKSPNHVYKSPLHNRMLCLPKNSTLTAEITRWFTEASHPNYPLTTTKFLDLMKAEAGAETINLFMDLERIGEHQDSKSGIFDFFEHLPEAAIKAGLEFLTPSEVFDTLTPVGKYDVPSPVTWSFPTYDLSYINGSDIQQEAITRLYDLAEWVYAKGDAQLLEDWRKLQSTDHFFYMTPRFEEKGEKNIFSPFPSAYDAYNNYMNIMVDMELRAKR